MVSASGITIRTLRNHQVLPRFRLPQCSISFTCVGGQRLLDDDVDAGVVGGGETQRDVGGVGRRPAQPHDGVVALHHRTGQHHFVPESELTQSGSSKRANRIEMAEKKPPAGIDSRDELPIGLFRGRPKTEKGANRDETTDDQQTNRLRIQWPNNDVGNRCTDAAKGATQKRTTAAEMTVHQ